MIKLVQTREKEKTEKMVDKMKLGIKLNSQLTRTPTNRSKGSPLKINRPLSQSKQLRKQNPSCKIKNQIIDQDQNIPIKKNIKNMVYLTILENKNITQKPSQATSVQTKGFKHNKPNIKEQFSITTVFQKKFEQFCQQVQVQDDQQYIINIPHLSQCKFPPQQSNTPINKLIQFKSGNTGTGYKK